MVDSKTSEALERFDYWLTTKILTNNHTPLVRGAIKGGSKEWKEGFSMAMMLVSTWLTDVSLGRYDTEEYNLKFGDIDYLVEKYKKALGIKKDKFGGW